MALVSFAATAKDYLTCPICMESFIGPHEPKELDCQHAFCQVCLNRLVKKGCISCPVCPNVTQIPAGGVAALKTYLLLRNMAEDLQQHVQRKERNLPDCCPDHNFETMHFFCETCNKPICQFCLSYDHKSHSIKGITEYKHQQQEKIAVAAQKLRTKIPQWEQHKDNLFQQETKVQSRVNHENEKIQRYVAYFQEHVKHEGECLVEDLQQQEKDRLDQIRMEKQRAEKLLQKVSEAERVCEKTLQAMPDGDNMLEIDCLITQMESLQAQTAPFQIDESRNVVQFEPQHIHDIEIGRLEEVGKVYD